MKRTMIELIVGVAVVALFVGILIQKEHAANLRTARLEEQIKAAQDQINEARADQKKADGERDAAIAKLEEERKKPATVQTVKEYIQVPGQIQIVPGPPGQPAEIHITGDAQQNLDALQTFGIECAECKVNLKTALRDLENEKKISAGLKSQLDSRTTELKGGTKLQRFNKALKIVGCAGGGAALGSLLGKTKGAAIGAAAGAGGCQLVF